MATGVLRDYEALAGHGEPDVALALALAAQDAEVADIAKLTPDQYLDWYELSPSTRPGVDEIFEHFQGAWPAALAAAETRHRELFAAATRELEARQQAEERRQALAAKAEQALRQAKEGEPGERIVSIEAEHYGYFTVRYDVKSGEETTDVQDTQETRSLTVTYADGHVKSYDLADFYRPSPYREPPPLAVRALWNELLGYEYLPLEVDGDDELDDELDEERG